MSTRSTIVQLIQTPIGRQAQILAAVPFLHQSLNAQIMARQRQGYLNKYPALSAIQLTHFLPMNTSFKPCVIVAFEYIRSNEKSCPGQSVEIEMKQNCDYINDMYLEVDTPQVSCNLANLPDIVVKPKNLDTYALNGSVSLNFGTGALNTPTQEASGTIINVPDGVNYLMDLTALPPVPVDTPIEVNGQDYVIQVSDIPGGVPNGGITYTYVDAAGNFIAGPDGRAANPGVNGFGGGQVSDDRVQRANYTKGAELFGLKMFPRIYFRVDDNTISDYSSKAAVAYRKRRLGPLTRRAFDRLIGQETPDDEVLGSHTLEGSTSSSFPVGGEHLQTGRHYMRTANGLQTPKPVHESTKIIVPILHWFTVERRTSLPVVCMPDGKLIIKADVAKTENLFYPAPGLFIEERVTAVSVVNPVGTLAVPNLFNLRRIPYVIPGSVVVANDNASDCITLVTCNILLDELIHNIVINRIGFNLIILHREEIQYLKNSESDTVNVNQLKWPTEYIHIFDQLAENVDERLSSTAENWHRCGKITQYDTTDYIHHPFQRVVGGVTQYELHRIPRRVSSSSHVQNVVSNLGVYIYDAPFFSKDNTRTFYSDYLPFTYSNGNISCDTEKDSPIFINFANVPGPYQPSGFVNLSKNKNMYLELEIGPELSTSKKGLLHMIAIVRNFILIADGSCIVRFS